MCTFTVHLLPVSTDDLRSTCSSRACVGLSPDEHAVGFQEVTLTQRSGCVLTQTEAANLIRIDKASCCKGAAFFSLPTALNYWPVNGWYWAGWVFKPEVMSPVNQKENTVFSYGNFNLLAQFCKCARFQEQSKCFCRTAEFPHDTRFHLEPWLDIPLTSENVFHMKTLYVTSWPVWAAWKPTPQHYSSAAPHIRARMTTTQKHKPDLHSHSGWLLSTINGLHRQCFWKAQICAALSYPEMWWKRSERWNFNAAAWRRGESSGWWRALWSYMVLVWFTFLMQWDEKHICIFISSGFHLMLYICLLFCRLWTYTI